MTMIWLAVALLALAAAMIGAAWGSHRASTRALDRWGRVYGVQRWEKESNCDYADRIANRMAITGGKRSWR